MVATRRSNSVDNSSVLQEKSSGEKNAANSTSVSKTRVRRMVSSGTKRNIFMDPDDIDQVRQSSQRPRATARAISPSSEEMDDQEESPVSRSVRTRSSQDIHYRTHRIGTRRSSRTRSPDYMLRRSSRRRKQQYVTLDEDMTEHIQLLRGEVFEGENNSVDKNQTESKSRRAELRDLLAMQGKDLSDMNAYMEPDIYSSVKSRKRASTKNRLYGEYYTNTSTQKRSRHDIEEGEETQSSEEEDEQEEDEHTNEEQEEEEEEEERVEESENETEEEENDDGHKYQLRKVREAPQRYTIVQEAQPRRSRSLFEALPCSPVRRRRKKVSGSSDHNPYQKRRRRSRVQANSSTSTDSSSDDEIKFRKRQQRSMAKARNKCMPINISAADIGNHSFARDRKKIGQSLADIDPMTLDTSVNFTSVGGHNKHIRALKEMIVFPLLYPEVFAKFNISPPRGCLFYGPPGTGKTLMARALANECSTDGKKVSFFMKKGADCLSKWIGESERQLRLLFDQAYQMRPSIIFFDEIDGLAPVRSTRQDQIHSSIVSTLLALMDGLDSRGEIVVIGATNRIDSIDPALRRPGRFDREFLFPLPDKEAREQIMKIHTSAWNPQLKPSYINYLATKTVGYCGADLKALCTEAALFALRRRYPQIYKSSDKLQLDISSIKISGIDFLSAIKNIIPTAQRSATNHGRDLHSMMKPLLGKTLLTIVTQLGKVFPVLNSKSKLLQETKSQDPESSTRPSQDSDAESDPETSTFGDGIYVGEPDLPVHLSTTIPNISSNSNGMVQPQYQSLIQRLSTVEHSLSTVHRPRFIICGDGSSGHISHLTPALIHDMEGVPIHTIDLPTLYGVSVRTPEESCAHVFREARRVTPSVIYLPNALQWWNVASPTVLATLETLLQDIPPNSPILLLATANCSYRQLPRELAKFFHSDFSEVHEASIQVTAEQRRDFFAPIFLVHALTPPPHNRHRTVRLEVLQKAPIPEPVPLTEQEERKLEKDEESTLRNLRLFLRDVLMRLMRDRRFKIFAKPVDFEEVPDYMEVIKSPMDFSTILTKIDQHKYQTVAHFLGDVDLICNNALEYNPDRRPEDKLIRHRACAMRDMAHAIVDQDLDPDFEKLCHDIVQSRIRRGAKPNKYAPRFYPVLPKHLTIHPITGEVVPKTPEPSEATTQKETSPVADASAVKSAWKLPQRKIPSSRQKRKRSSWSRGVVSCKKRKKKSVIIEEDDEEEDEEEKKEGGKEEESSEQDDDSHDPVPLEDEDDDQEEREEDGENENGEATTSEGSTADVANHVEDNEDDEEEEEEEQEEDEALSEKNSSPASDRPNEEEDRFHGTENGDEDTHVGRNLANLFDQADQLLKQKENSISSEVTEPIVRNGFADGVEDDKRDILENSSNSGGSTPVATIYPDLDAVNEDDGNSLVKKEEDVEEPMQEDPATEEGGAQPRRMTLRSHDKPTSETNPGMSKSEVEEPPPTPPPPFIVDHKALVMQLEAVVLVTESFSVEELERVYSTLSKCVNKHKMSYDRTDLQQELKQEISSIRSVTATRLGDFSTVS